MYNNFSAASLSVTAPAAASTMPLDFPLGPQTEPYWLVLGGFAIFAALLAVKRIAPTWTDLVGTDENAAAAGRPARLAV